MRKIEIIACHWYFKLRGMFIDFSNTLIKRNLICLKHTSDRVDLSS